MPLTGFLQGEKFDRETVRVMSIAFEMTRIALSFRDGIGDELIAKKIIELAKAGEIDPNRLCDRAFVEITAANVHGRQTES
jgi:hypothetical protein